jgi:hypothetical protein
MADGTAAGFGEADPPFRGTAIGRRVAIPFCTVPPNVNTTIT